MGLIKLPQISQDAAKVVGAELRKGDIGLSSRDTLFITRELDKIEKEDPVLYWLIIDIIEEVKDLDSFVYGMLVTRRLYETELQNGQLEKLLDKDLE